MSTITGTLTSSGAPEDSYNVTAGQLQKVLRELEDANLPLEELAGKLEQSYALFEKLRTKLTHIEAAVEKIIRLHSDDAKERS
jgi:exodeoxyribonuclease VII small subunit